MYFRHTYQAELTVADTFTSGGITYMVYQLRPRPNNTSASTVTESITGYM